MATDWSFLNTVEGGASAGGGLLSSAPSTAGAAGSGMSGILGAAGPAFAIFGALQAGFGSYFSAQSQKSSLQFQSDMSAINARMAEKTAQNILQQGEQAQSQVGLKAGKVAGAQKASQGARGIAIGEGSAAEEIATTNLMKETDMMTINANAVRASNAARTQSVNAANDSLLKGTSADSISPFSAASTSLISSASTVASSWYASSKMNRMAAALGVS